MKNVIYSGVVEVITVGAPAQKQWLNLDDADAEPPLAIVQTTERRTAQDDSASIRDGSTARSVQGAGSDGVQEAKARAEGVGVIAVLLDELAQRLAPRLAPLLSARWDSGAASQKAGPSLLCVEEAAERLGLSPSTIYKRAESGQLPSVKDGGRLLFKVIDLDEYVAARRSSSERVAALARDARSRSYRPTRAGNSRIKP